VLDLPQRVGRFDLVAASAHPGESVAAASSGPLFTPSSGVTVQTLTGS